MTGSKATSSGTTPAKKPVRRKAVAKNTVKKAGTQKTAAKKTTGAKKKKQVPICTSKERHEMIAKTAYFIAESRGFEGGNPEQDWLDAAEEIDSKIINA